MRGEISGTAIALGGSVRLNRTMRPQFGDVLADKNFAAVVIFATAGLTASIVLTSLFSVSAEFVCALAQLN